MKVYYLSCWLLTSSYSLTPLSLSMAAPSSSSSSSSSSFRGGSFRQPPQPRIRKPVSNETCATTSIVDVQYEDRSIEESYVVCETSDGKSYKVNGINATTVRAEQANIIRGESEVDLPAGSEVNEAKGEIDLPPGLQARFKKKTKGKSKGVTKGKDNKKGNEKGKDKGRGNLFNRERSLLTNGLRSVLVVRVIASDASTTASVERLSDSVFGNGADTNADSADPVTLRSQYKACSYDQLEFVPAGDRDGNSTNIRNGAVTITVSTSRSETDSVMRNDIADELLAQFGMPAKDLANHVMMCMPPGTMAGIAYAFPGGWMSVYSDNWCTSLSAQMHEIGHNLLLAHSNEIGTYRDQSGMMGFSYYNDNGPLMCFNGAKSWQLGWYASRHHEFVGADRFWNGRLIGQVDHKHLNALASDKVLLKLNRLSSANDYYVQFNRKSGTNSGTVEGGDQVTIVEAGEEGETYAESELLAKLGEGGTFVLPNFDNSIHDLELRVHSIDLDANPPFADISVRTGCTSDLQCGDGNSCNGIETCNLDTQLCVPGFPLAGCCGNGICEAGETLSSCSSDCTICGNVATLFQVNVLTDNFPFETSWTLVNTCTGGTLEANPLYPTANTQYSNDYCIPEAQAFTFQINDTYGDGICCSFGQGSYELVWGASTIKNGGSFRISEATSFGECGVVTSEPTSSPITPLPTSSPTKSPTSSPISAPTRNTTMSPTTAGPSPSPTKSPTASPVSAPTHSPSMNPTTADPSPSPTKSPTASPISSPTRNPTMNPTTNPTTADPTTSPTKSPTDSPVSAPTRIPTMSPTTTDPTPSPTKLPTDSPISAPALKPTMIPTTADATPSPTKSPTTSPISSPARNPTMSPTTADPTLSPTKSPTDSPISAPTRNPTMSPTTVDPTPSPTSTDSPIPAPTILLATYDSVLGAPRCIDAGSSCSSGAELINGKQSANFGANAEPNSSHNTVDTCVDGTGGSYHNGESIDAITVAAVGGGQLQEGGLAEIQATVYAWNTGAADTADFYYASDATSPVWVFAGSMVPPTGGLQTLSVEYTIPAGIDQVVRVNFRYSGSRSPCTGGRWDDVDDLIFSVAAGAANAAASSAGLKPISVPVAAALTADICGTVDQRDRCNELDLCFWRGKKCRPTRM